MPRPGFYNDNEYRAYPFIFKAGAVALPYSTVVDCGIIMGLDSEFDGEVHEVWLQQIKRLNNTFEFEFATNAPGAAQKPLVFQRDVDTAEWLMEDAESEPYVKDVNSCATEPAWSGFLVTGPLKDLEAALPNDGTITLGTAYTLEPARIQSLVRSYLRAVSLGNFSRPRARSACDNSPGTPRHVVINKRCIAGDIRFKEGYNAQIRQRVLTNEIVISAGRGFGAQYDAELCQNHGEIPFYDGEQKPILFPAADGRPEVRSKFFSGGPACDELVSSINGVTGPDVTIVGGTGINVRVDQDNPNTILVTLSTTNIAGNC
jgi:hypothetical protein